jgi:hypothetical protein
VWSFLKVVLLIDLVILIAGYWPASLAEGSGHYTALFLATVLTTFNVLFSFYSVERTLNSKNGAMMGAVFGGMGIRLIIMLGAVVAVIFLTDLPQFSFIFSLFICYLSKSVAEIIFINHIRNKSLPSS